MSQAIAVNTQTQKGTKILRLVQSRFNSGKGKDSGNEMMTSNPTTVASCRINSGRILMADSYVGKIQRPKLKIKANVTSVKGEISEDVDVLGFLPDEQPEVDYVYELNDEQVKSFVDAGLFSDPRFDKVMSRILRDELFDMDLDMQFHQVLLNDEDQNKKVPIVLADFVHSVVHNVPITEDDKENEPFTTFSGVITNVVAMAIELKRQGFDSTELVGSENEREDEIVDLSSEFENETDILPDHIEDETHNDELDKEDYEKSEINASELKGPDNELFGETSQESQIDRLKEANRRRWENIKFQEKTVKKDDLDLEI